MNYPKFSFDRLKPESYGRKEILIYIIIAYIFGVGVRMILLYQMGEIEGFWDNASPVPIWTQDAGRYGFYSKEILSGVLLPLRDDYLLGYLVAFVSLSTQISVDWVMLIFPIVIAPLIVFPVIMIGTSIKQLRMGFLSALVAVSGTFYYVRSNIGYMDTDGVNLFLMLLGIAWIIKSYEHRSIAYSALAALALMLLGQWYHSAPILNLLIFVSIFAYLLLFKRQDKVMLQGLILLALTIVPAGFALKLGILIVATLLFLFLNQKTNLDYRFYGGMLIAGFLLSFFWLHPDHYVQRALTYLSPSSSKTFSGQGIDYYYLNDLNFVAEVQKANIWNAYAPSFVSTLYVVVATLGYILLVMTYPLMFLTFPLMLLGYLSSFAGLRFTIFATPALALGFVYLLYVLRNVLSLKFQKPYYSKRIPYYGTVLILVLMIYNIFYFNSQAIMGLQFYKWEKSELASLGKKMNDKDTVVTWWEYGWPLWYYTGHDNTLTDNGYHGGPDSHLVAQLLLSDNPFFVANVANYLSDFRKPPGDAGNSFVLPVIAQEQNLSRLLIDFHKNKRIEKQTNGDVYILLHQGMLSYFGVLLQYATWDISQKGVYRGMPQYESTPIIKPFSHNHSLLEGYSYILDSSDGKVIDSNGNKTPLNTLMIVEHNKRKEGFSFHNDSKKYMVSVRGQLIWLDKSLYDSFYIQAMFFDVYDKNLFEKVAETPRVKIFRVKRPGE